MKTIKTKPITRTIATALLFLFCVNPLCYAEYSYNVTDGENGEVIIGEPQNMQPAIIKTEKIRTDQNNEINTYAITHPANSSESQYKSKENESLMTVQNDKLVDLSNINIKTIDLNDKILQKYQKEFRIYLGSCGSAYMMTFPNPAASLLHYNVEVQGDLSGSSGKIYHDKTVTYQKIPLQDGDYVIFPTEHTVDYLGEYHRDGSMMGIVEIRLYKKSKNECLIQLSEYRMTNVNFKTESSKARAMFSLENIMFMELHKNRNNLSIAQFIYSKDGTLKCYALDKDVYVAEGERNMLTFENSTLNLNSMYESASLENKAGSNVATVATTAMPLIAITMAPAIAIIGLGVGLPLVAATLPITIPLIFFMSTEMK